jgi:nitrite reductase (NO-forming)
MRILGKVSFRSLLLLAITFASVGIVAVIITLPTFMVDANHAFALNQNSLLSQQQQKNDNINQDSNITKKFTLIADENVVKISPNNLFHPSGVLYKAMTFNYTIPGPVIAVNQGDTFQITIQNKGQMIHSLDLHGIEGPDQALSGTVQPGESKTWKVKAINAGVFMYHCDGDNLNGIWDHIASGMYGGIVVHSKDERKAAKEFYLVFGEIYNNADKGLFNDITQTNTTIGSFDMAKFVANKPDLILTNGMAYKYIPYIIWCITTCAIFA